jgi:hypothetical protein
MSNIEFADPAIADQAREPRRVELSLTRRADGRLWAERGGDARPVSVRRCFPWSEPARYVSLRDDDEEEFALVADLADLDSVSRAALQAALAEAGFVFVVTAIREVEEEVEIRAWRVETTQGARRFQTRLDDWPRELPGGGILIRDVAGDLYHVPHPRSLDRRSRQLLWAFVD